MVVVVVVCWLRLGLVRCSLICLFSLFLLCVCFVCVCVRVCCFLLFFLCVWVHVCFHAFYYSFCHIKGKRTCLDYVKVKESGDERSMLLNI